MDMDWRKLIAEVEKEPYLWKTPKRKRHIVKCDILWKQIAENIGSTVRECKSRWKYLHYAYMRHKKAAAKEENYICKWEYWDHLRFLDDRIQLPKRTRELDVREMIAKVKERPYLWKVPFLARNKRKTTVLWQEIAEHVGVDLEICRDKWRKLLRTHKGHMEKGTPLHSNFQFSEDLKFMDDTYEEYISLNNTAQKVKEVDKFALIALIEERPHLWQIPPSKRNVHVCKSLWKEIADSLGVDESKCKALWGVLRCRYFELKKREEQDPETYCAWQYYNALTFLDKARRSFVAIEENKFFFGQNKLTLIELVKNRPKLWKIGPKDSNNTLWKEVGKILGTDAKVCRTAWYNVRFKYKTKKIQGATTWEYYDHLTFLDEVQDFENNDTDHIDKNAFITKVKERPQLWREGSPENAINRYEIECLWKEISELLDINYDKCKKLWKTMFNLYKTHKKAEETLLESSKKYNSMWEYYEKMKFLEDVDYKVPDRDLLIAKVKQAPKLWKDDLLQSSDKIITNIWKEIAGYLSVQEETCRNIWTDLHLLFFKHKEKRDKLLEENPSEKYECSFQYFDNLRFLSGEALDSVASEEFLTLDKLKLINTLKERPYLWKTEPKDRNKVILKYYWSQVQETLSLPEKLCEKEWEELLTIYNEEKKNMEILKEEGNVDRNYSSKWEYFEHMKFLDAGISDESSFEDDDNEDENVRADRMRIKMIKAIEKRTPLWKNPMKTNKVLNAHLWAEVSSKSGLDVKACKYKWGKLKGRYMTLYVLYRENKINLGQFRMFQDCDHFQFLNEYIDEDDNQLSNSADTEQELSLTQLESICEKEEPVMQSSSLTNIPLETIQNSPKSPETQILKEAPNTDVSFIKEEFEIDFHEQQKNRLKNAHARPEQDIEISNTTNNFVDVKNECLKVDSCKILKTAIDSDFEFIKNSTSSENRKSCPMESELKSKTNSKAQYDKSLTNAEDDKAEQSKKRKRSGKMANESKEVKKRRKRVYF